MPPNLRDEGRADGSAWPPLRFGRASLRLVAGASLGAVLMARHGLPQVLRSGDVVGFGERGDDGEGGGQAAAVVVAQAVELAT